MTRHPKAANAEETKFRAFLKASGLRVTPERLEIMRTAVGIEGHFDAESLHARLERRGYHVSKATLYSALTLLCDAGLVRKLLFDNHQARFELASRTHSHLVCTSCGKITEVDIAGFDSAWERVKEQGFSPAYASTCIYGLCRDCWLRKLES